MEKKAATKPKAKKTTPKAPKEGGFAVFTTGGKQYKVAVGDKIKIEKILGALSNSGYAEFKEGDKLTFDQVLLIDSGEAKIGTPFISGAKIEATLSKISRYKTIDVIKYKQKSRYFKKYGHRQPYFEVTIDSVKNS